MPIDVPVLGAQNGGSEMRALPRPADLQPLDPDPNWRVATTRRLLREFERGIHEGHSPAPNLDDALRCQAVWTPLANRPAPALQSPCRPLNPRPESAIIDLVPAKSGFFHPAPNPVHTRAGGCAPVSRPEHR